MGELAQHHQTAELGGPSGLLADWTRDSDIVQRGAATFVEVGHALRRIRASGSYRAAGYETFEAATRALTGHGYHQARNLLRATEVVERLASSPAVADVPLQDLSERALRPVAALPESLQAEALRRAEQLRVDEGASTITNHHTAAAVAELRQELGGRAPRQRGEPHADGHDSDEVGTPAVIVAAARSLMGGITFDPFSSARFNELVNADRILTRGDDATKAETWDALDGERAVYGAAAKWWVNPPYSRASAHVQAVLERFWPTPGRRPKGRQCCILLNTDTGAAIHQELLVYSSAAVFLRGRVDWWWPLEDGSRHTGGGGRASSVLYYLGGAAPSAVRRFFGPLGAVLIDDEVRGEDSRASKSWLGSSAARAVYAESRPGVRVSELEMQAARKKSRAAAESPRAIVSRAGQRVEVLWPGAATGTGRRPGKFVRFTATSKVVVQLYNLSPKGKVLRTLGSERTFELHEVEAEDA